MYGFPSYQNYRCSKYRAPVELMSVRCIRMAFWNWINSFTIPKPAGQQRLRPNRGRSDKEIEPG